MLGSIIFYSFIVMLASLVGVFSVWKKAGEAIERNLHFLVSFSAGVFFIIAFELAKETFENSSSFGAGFLWVFAGALGIIAFFKFLPFFHHHHDESAEKTAHSIIDGRRILFSDALHNIGDGILLTASFGVDFKLGVITVVSVFIHELVQEISEFFILRRAGYSVKKALAVNFLFSATILIGAIGSFFLLETFESFEAPLLGIAAGSFLVVVGHDLIPHSIKNPTFKLDYKKHLVWFVVGLILMLVADSLLAH